MIKVLIADDHPIFRQGIKQVLEENPDIEVAGEATTGKEALNMIRQNAYDAVTLDISMPDINGLEILKYIHAEKPELPVLMLSIYPEEQFAIRALRAGAAGYLTKTSVPEELVTALKKIVSGTRYITTSLAEKLAMDIQSPKDNRQPHELLSDREYEVMRMIGQGKTVSEIAEELKLSVKTVSTHRAHILTKMRMETNAQVMRYAMEHHLA